MVTKRGIRVFLVGVILLSSLVVINAYASPTRSVDFSGKTQTEIHAETDQVVPPRGNITVIATDSNSWLGQRSSGPRARAELVAFRPNGSLLYYNDSHTRYWDVDPVPRTRDTVEYSYADHVPDSKCPTNFNLTQRMVTQDVWSRYAKSHADEGACTRNGIERVNLTTGNVTPIWSEVTPGKEATRYHDADRLNETHFVVADIYLDRVFVVNTTSGQTEWTWNASEAFSRSTGGPYPRDWTHINDVNVLDDGRLMVSARNQDRVVFLEPGRGLQTNWTLGTEDDYRVLYEQHNPDYIPKKNGGPAAIVADSENNRVVEYQRENSDWKRTWTWQDPSMQWPRDADRLPNGNTLITDSNGNRVVEVNDNGTVVWSVQIAFPYEAERLGTGDESTGGPSAKRATIQSRSHGIWGGFWITVKDVLPGKYVNGLMYITPAWMGMPTVFALVVGILGIFSLLLLEVRWRVQWQRLRPSLRR